MLGELKQPEYELALLVATCGLRISEAPGLKWRDILWSKGLIAMRQTFVHFHLQDGDTCGCPANQGQGDVRAGWGDKVRNGNTDIFAGIWFAFGTVGGRRQDNGGVRSPATVIPNSSALVFQAKCGLRA